MSKDKKTGPETIDDEKLKDVQGGFIVLGESDMRVRKKPKQMTDKDDGDGYMLGLSLDQ